MDKFIKRLQTRASRKGINVSKSQVREVYQSVVSSPESPSEEEMSAVIQRLEAQYLAPSYGSNESHLATTEESIATQEKEEMSTKESRTISGNSSADLTPAQAAQQPTNSTLATSNRSAISQPSSASLGVTQQQIQDAVEQQFGRENIETKTAILNYVAQDTFSTAQELQQALSKLRQMKLDILMKLISDHNQQSAGDENLLKSALMNASANRREESEDFFAGFENQLAQMRAAFGV